MKIIHYGAGNIGRGFIAPILLNNNQNNEFWFVDSNENIINLLKNKSSYKVIELDENKNTTFITGYKAVKPQDLEKNVDIENIDIITTSIGSNNLSFIKNQIISIIKIKEVSKKNLIIMCCENGVNISNWFSKEISKDYSYDNKLIFFVDVMVDRIVPNKVLEDANVEVEPYYSWVVDETNWPVKVEKINNITYTNNINAEICKKVWMLNGGHASLSWKEWKLSKFKNKIINKTLNDENNKELILFLKNYLLEISKVLELEFNLKKESLDTFIDTVIKRFKNIHINDEFERVARNTIKKIQLDERILMPFSLAIKNNIECNYIKETIINAISYNNVNDVDGNTINELTKKGYNKFDLIKELINNIDDSLINEILK
ncbi:mannitol-1-phosphate 5-dehydrogenase [Spiroplasma litorale]|uniref:Mannitol-1-phosphate 5-dehydrogenase n=1 Tax=Spiroplasma litorale TaxID=216942 RepID=A0A0K1W2K6_9MOLU|nr:hypothetical protein [Spiroplasma litorale]AKX34312.1 mannitol-1-phosphate 5-dehydrogenase [Spiroplasma litorale]